jgi:AraC-like DNA-binding protein
MAARQAATYGRSERLGGVEFLSAQFTAHRFAPHSHPGFAIGAVRSGACRIWQRGESRVARRGDLVLIDPDAPHSADPGAGVAWDYCAVYLTVETARAWLPASLVPSVPGFRAVVAHDEDLSARLEWLCGALARDPEDGHLELSFAPFMDALFRRFGRDRSGAAGGAGEADDSAPWVARRHIDAHFARPIGIDELAALTHRSPFGLIRGFTRTFGISPYAYITQRRVARAQDLLRAGHRISDAAFDAGFSDQSHLTRFFRRVVGVPPGAWLRGVTRAEGSPAGRAS